MPVEVFIDLTAPVADGIPGVGIQPAKTIEKDGWNATTLTLYSHSGTHMDSPMHFDCGDQTVDQIPLARCLGTAWVVDLPDLEPKTLLTKAHLGDIVDRFHPGESLLLRTGWHRHRGNPEIFRHGLPRVDEELALWMVEAHVNMLGVEPPSVADVDNLPEVARIHQILLGGDVVIVEGLHGLDRISAEKVRFGAFPLRIQGGDGSPCRAFAVQTTVGSPHRLPFRETMESLPRRSVHDLSEAIRKKRAEANIVIAVLDDDPTGTQTVSGVNVYTDWNHELVVREMKQGPGLFFLLTNSRALQEPEAVQLACHTGRLLAEAAQAAGCRVLAISRGDSTLRGHYPAEVDALGEGLGTPDAPHVIAPFFEAGGRITIEDTHYVHEGGWLVPAAETPFAKDPTFGYAESNLRDWIREKTGRDFDDGDFQSISIASSRAGEPEAVDPSARAILLNAAIDEDLQVPALALLDTVATGQPLLFRTAASLVRIIAGQPRRPLLSTEELRNDHGRGGLFVVGSFVPKSTRQLERLLTCEKVVPVEVDVAKVLGPDEETYRAGLDRALNEALAADQCLVVYTSRELKTGTTPEESLRINVRVSDFLVRLVSSIEVAPRFFVAKGGITSCELARQALGVRKATVLGQALPGVPVWRLGEGSRHEGLVYVVFPGNVGADDALLTLAERLT